MFQIRPYQFGIEHFAFCIWHFAFAGEARAPSYSGRGLSLVSGAKITATRPTANTTATVMAA